MHAAPTSAIDVRPRAAPMFNEGGRRESMSHAAAELPASERH